MGSLLIKGGTYFQTRPSVEAPLRGNAMASVPRIDNGYLLAENGIIRSVGPLSEAPERADRVIDARERYILPSWCDSHTHIVFARSREEEFVMRIKGLSYEEIAASGGGILNSAEKLRLTSEEELFESALERLHQVIGFGTGALEIKSGYGLSTESEYKMLRVIRRLKEQAPIPIRATFLGAHAIPREYKGNRDQYIRLLTDIMIPYIVGEGLAEYIDVFCDRGFFTIDESEVILDAATKAGLKPKIHVSEIENIGGVQMGIRHHALSVDHLECAGLEEAEALASAETIATLLPSCAFFLGLRYPPARKLIEKGAIVALASDFNPGSTPSGNMQFVMALACIQMQMLPEEALNAATINGAFAMEVDAQCGSLTPGKLANVMITKPIPSLAYIPYAFGQDHIGRIILRGEEWSRQEVV